MSAFIPAEILVLIRAASLVTRHALRVPARGNCRFPFQLEFPRETTLHGYYAVPALEVPRGLEKVPREIAYTRRWAQRHRQRPGATGKHGSGSGSCRFATNYEHAAFHRFASFTLKDNPLRIASSKKGDEKVGRRDGAASAA